MNRVESMVCSWCGGGIAGEPFSMASSTPFTWGDGKVEVELVAGWEAVFCCGGCEWNFQLDKHRLIGLPGRDARRHLVEVHKLKPGRPAGKQSRACYEQSKELARASYRLFFGELPGGLN